MPSGPCPPYEPRHRKTSCKVPGCEEEKVTYHCCYTHSIEKQHHGDLDNDGLIDWVAIDVASRRLREVRLTWVEQDIAVAVLLARGHGTWEAQKSIGIINPCRSNGRRIQDARKMAEAGVLEMLERELEHADEYRARRAQLGLEEVHHDN